MSTAYARRIKKVLTRSGRVQWFLGDGLWFGRISEAKAREGLASGLYTMWEVKAPKLALVATEARS